MRFALFFLGALFLVGCSQAPGQFAYVCSANGQICAFKVAPDGSLSAASNSTAKADAIELSSDGSALVALTSGGAQAYHRDPSSGNLTEWGKRVPGAGGYGKDVVAFGEYFYGVYTQGEDDLASFHLDPQEGLKEGASANMPQDDPVALAMSPDGKNLYACYTRPATLVCFSADPRNGRLNLEDTPPLGGNPHGVAVDPTGKCVLGVSSMDLEHPPKLFSFQATGKDLVEVGNITVPSPQSVLIHPNGKWVYVGHYLPNSKGDKQDGVAQYLLDPSNGSVKLAVEGTPDAKQIGRLALDSGAQHLYALDREGNCLLHYQLDPATGAPKLSGDPVPIEKPTDLVLTRAASSEKK